MLEGTLREIGAMLEPLNHQRLGYHRMQEEEVSKSKKGLSRIFCNGNSAVEYSDGYDFYGEQSSGTTQDKRKNLLKKSADDSSFVGRSYRRQNSIDYEALSSAGTKIRG